MCAKDLDNILIVGDKLYRYIRKRVNNIFLMPIEVPKHILFCKTYFNIACEEPYVGFLGYEKHSYNSSVCLDLGVALQIGSRYGKFLVIINSSAVGIVFKENTYFLFDPHSRRCNGLSADNGKCIIMRFEDLFELTKFLKDVMETIELYNLK